MVFVLFFETAIQGSFVNKKKVASSLQSSWTCAIYREMKSAIFKSLCVLLEIRRKLGVPEKFWAPNKAHVIA